MPIYPLPQFEADLKQMLDAPDRAAYDALAAPKSVVVRFGSMKLIGEYPYDGTAKPGCGSKLVVRTHRGTELAEMLTSTCPNAGCSKSVSRKQMLEYIDRSGGRDYPFFTEGRVLGVASPADLERQARIEQSKHGMRLAARAIVERYQLAIKIVEVEPLLGGERIVVHVMTPPDQRVDFRDLARELSAEFRARVDMHPVGMRDEARITADYERCGQHCCCKNFLKVLKPVSIKAAKVQKATLDPLKISGRCGKLMCCLRYEDQTYAELAKRLPKRKTRVGTPDGDGYVLDSQILTQLVLVLLDSNRQVAIPVEELTPPTSMAPPEVGSEQPSRPPRGDRRPAPRDEPRRADAPRPPRPEPAPRDPAGDQPPQPSDQYGGSRAPGEPGTTDNDPTRPRKRRRRKRRRGGGPGHGGPAHGPGAPDPTRGPPRVGPGPTPPTV